MPLHEMEREIMVQAYTEIECRLLRVKAVKIFIYSATAQRFLLVHFSPGRDSWKFLFCLTAAFYL